MLTTAVNLRVSSKKSYVASIFILKYLNLITLYITHELTSFIYVNLSQGTILIVKYI